jgi:hypothetical protein
MIKCIGGNKCLSYLCGETDTIDIFKIEIIEFIVKLQFNETR